MVVRGNRIEAPPQTLRVQPFDVVCAGITLESTAAIPGGALAAAIALARLDSRSGLVTTLRDDRKGRAMGAMLEGLALDSDGVTFSPPESGILFVSGTGGARQVASYRDQDTPIAVPAEWTAKVLLLSGVSPMTAYMASACKAARDARRRGSIVLCDLNARTFQWAGHDPRRIRMLLREADVVRGSIDDLSAIGVRESDVLASMRPTAVLVVSRARGIDYATGPFGEVVCAPEESALLRPRGSGDVFAASLAFALARAEVAFESRASFWDRALRDTQAAIGERRG